MLRSLSALSIALLLVVAGCDSFVENVEEDPGVILPGDLEDPAQLSFVTNGVLLRFSNTHDELTVAASLLSDVSEFGTNPDATFPTFAEIDIGEITLDNNTIDGVYGTLGNYRFLADNLIDIVEQLDAEDAFESEDNADRLNALFVGYLHGGIARYFYATYFGVNPDQGGSPIGGGRFLTSEEIYERALNRLNSAFEFAQTDYETRLVNSIIARIHLFQGSYSAALTSAEAGLEVGDPPFQSLHNTQSANEWFFTGYKTTGGDGRLQVVQNERFRDYVTGDTNEDARIPLRAILLQDVGETPTGTIVEDVTAFSPENSEVFQDLYTSRGSPITFMSWEETYLIRAEAAFRAGNEGAALDLVNTIRESYLIDPLDEISLEIIAAERDKQLFTEGVRLVDQRRLEVVPFHLPADRWRYLPITQQERLVNPCVPEVVGAEPNQDPSCTEGGTDA